MFNTQSYDQSIKENYQLLLKQLEALIEDETNKIANLANAAALLHQFLDRVNLVGFYLTEDEELVLGLISDKVMIRRRTPYFYQIPLPYITPHPLC
jgi:putative methionine-R-sulfoxide reductase with GAF domain